MENRYSPKIKVFMWRLARDIIPTKHNLSKKGVAVEGGCYMCRGGDETVQHLFFNCPFTQATATRMLDKGAPQGTNAE